MKESLSESNDLLNVEQKLESEVTAAGSISKLAKLVIFTCKLVVPIVLINALVRG